jgi:putative membrane protein
MTLEGFREFEAIRDFLYGRMRGVRAGTPAPRHGAAAGGLGHEAELAETLRAVASELRQLRLSLRPEAAGGAEAPRPPS